MQRGADREPISGPAIAQAQMGAYREWKEWSGERFADLKGIRQPTLAVKAFTTRWFQCGIPTG
jgi:hypothetical protein